MNLHYQDSTTNTLFINVSVQDLKDAGYSDAQVSEIVHENKLATVRAKRDRQLRETDKTVLVDSPYTEEEKNNWITYRQALRDLPGTNDNLDELIWPEPPEPLTEIE